MNDPAFSLGESTLQVPVSCPAAWPDAVTLPGYEVVELVGQGGMGRVYRARHLALDRTVALKVLSREPDEKMLARFREETRAVARLQHPNIAQLYESGVDEGRPYFTQEFVGGGTLAARLDGKPQDPAFAAGVVETIALAIQHSHAHGILHRDLKPGNVLLTDDGTPKVTDFGLAKDFRPSEDRPADALTRTGEIVGTPSYMPPEQASGITSALGPEADVYSMGAILYEALTGRPPFQSPQPLQTLLMVLSMDPVPPRTLLPKLPRDVETICLKCLEKSPKKRYATAQALADDLGRFRRGEPIVARPVGWLERAGKWAQRRKAAAALVGVSALSLVALVAAGIALAIGYSRQQQANRDLTEAKGKLEATNADLVAAKAESDRSFELAQGALDRLVKRVGLQLNGLPQAEKVMIDAFRESAAVYRQLHGLRPGDRDIIAGYAESLMTLLSIERSYANKGEMDRTQAELQDLLNRTLPFFPMDPRLNATSVRVTYDRLLTAEAGGDPAVIGPIRRHFIVHANSFLREHPHHLDAPSLTIFRHWAIANEAGNRNNYQDRRDALRVALVVARNQREGDPTNRSVATTFTTTLSLLGMVEEMRKDYKAADAAYAEAEKTHADGLARGGDAAADKVGLADMKGNRARIAVLLGDARAALDLFIAAEEMQREVAKLFPLDPYRKLELANSLSWRATLERSSWPKAAREHLVEAVDIVRKLVAAHPKNDSFAFHRDQWESMLKRMDDGK